VRPVAPLRTGILFVWLALALALAASPARALNLDGVTLDGELTYTSDYVLRGISQTCGRSAGQADLRLGTPDGTFVGAFGSTINRIWNRPTGLSGWDYEVEAYLGHRFDVSPTWSATITATDYMYFHGNAPFSDDYQEISATTSYLDLWTVEVAFIPNSVPFDRGYRLGRYPAYVASTSGQVPLIGRLALTAGAGYYTADGAGYGFGNAGLAFEFKSLRFDAGYYLAQDRAALLFPYGRAGSRFAGTVSWHF
jgi:uncharacterized protein (TIGR02001 family)